MSLRILSLAVLALAASLSAASAAPSPTGALQTFAISEPLGHRWQDELVHFDLNAATALQSSQLVLTDSAGKAVPFQFAGLARDPKTNNLRGQIWTVADLEPNGQTGFILRAGTATGDSDLKIASEGDDLVISNARLALRVPQWKTLAAPVALTTLAPPLGAIRANGGATWLGQGQWQNGGAPLMVKAAKTEIIERGPVRALVRQSLTFADGRSYAATIQLAARQDAAIVSEASDVDAPQAGWRFSLQNGLNADHVFWNNQWKKSDNAGTWALTDTAVQFDKENQVAQLRPWSFWWLPDITEWAGFYKQGDEDFVGFLALAPSRWLPGRWEGFDRTAIPITAGPGGRLDLSLGLLAMTQKGAGQLARAKDAIENQPDTNAQVLVPLRREWALTVGSVADNVIDTATAKPGTGQGTTKLRRQLSKYSEFPLDEVKDYGFDFQPAKAASVHPFLIVTPADIERVRRQAQTVPAVKAQVGAATNYLQATRAAQTLEKEGAQAFYTKNYVGNYLVEKLPEAYIGSDDPAYGKMLAAAVVSLTQELKNTFLEAPTRPALGAYGPWFSENITQLIFNYDLIAGKGLLTPAQDKDTYNTLVFGAHVLAHPDFWDPEHGLASANPNMTSSIRLPRGLLGLFLAGHPQSGEWLREAEDELKLELKDWVSPGGAWIESPGYQAASQDGMMLLAAALRNTGKHDYFADPKFKELTEYYGFLLTPPDRRFPPAGVSSSNLPTQTLPGTPAPMTVPSIGDTFAGMLTPFNGWMASATDKTDAAYSARQQWFWQKQNFHFNNGNRAKGMTLALTDAELPATPPTDLGRAFPGFGSVMRSSWTDPKATYLAHRTGPHLHHYHDDFNSFVLYSKGAPLCLDFGNLYVPVRRSEPEYHNRVSWAAPTAGSTGEIVEQSSLPGTLEYSYGLSKGGGNQGDHRYLMMIESADPMGANYVVSRDRTVDGQPNQAFAWNLWCLSKEPQVTGNLVHFPGQFDVDLDVHLLSPANPKITTDHWDWKQQIYVWGDFSEEQYGIHVAKTGSTEDYLAVLYPRATGQAAAQTTTLAGGVAVKVAHMEGEDWVLLSPGKAATIEDGAVRLGGEIAFARQGAGGALKLAVVKGADALASAGGWQLQSGGAVALEIKGETVTGTSSAAAHDATITLPENYGAVTVTLDGKATTIKVNGRIVMLALPQGNHSFAIGKK